MLHVASRITTSPVGFQSSAHLNIENKKVSVCGVILVFPGGTPPTTCADHKLVDWALRLVTFGPNGSLESLYSLAIMSLNTSPSRVRVYLAYYSITYYRITALA